MEDQHLEMMKSLKGVECSRSLSQTLQLRQPTTNGSINHLSERRDFLGDVSDVIFLKVYCSTISFDAMLYKEIFSSNIIMVGMVFEHYIYI